MSDGFIDRYTNLRVVVPPALRMISEIIPVEFPFHPNWAEGKCHHAYWDLSATVDHLTPVASGGTDHIANLVTTSMSKNLQKNSITFDELGWTLHDKTRGTNWDGLSRFYLDQCKKNPGLLKNPYFKRWQQVIRKVPDFA